MKRKLKKILAGCCLLGASVSAVFGFVNSGLVKAQSIERANSGDRAYYAKNQASVVSYEKHPNCDVSGVNAQLVLNDSLIMKNVVDLNQAFENDEAFIKMIPVTTTVGKAEYTQINLEMIDIHDENNFVKVQINAYPSLEDSAMSSYYSACASNGQKLTGVDELGNIYVNNLYGPYIPLSFSGLLGVNDIAGVFYNVETKTVYSEDYLGARKFVVDLDSPVYFGTNLWEGFTSNEVYCKISLGGRKAEKPSILVSNYGDYDLSNDKIYDVKAPVITVDYGEYTKKTVSQGVVNKPYSIFSASSFDAIDGAVKTQTNVYMDYYSSQKREVGIVHGSFTPRMAVPHYIVYTSQDARGNIAQEIVTVQVLAKSEPLSIYLGAVPNSVSKGENFTLPTYTVQGGVGIVNVTVKASVNGIEVDVQDGYFRPFATGELKITYYLRDYVGQTFSTSRTITVTEAEKPVFIEEPILPKYLIAGNRYVFPTLNAYNYVTANGEIMPTTISVVENNQVKVVESEYIPENVSYVEIVYTAKVGSAENTYRKTLPVYQVKDNDGLDMAKFFLCEDGSASATEDAVVLTGSTNSSFAFLNELSVSTFHTEFVLGAEPSKLGKLHILLTDAVNETKTIKFTYEFHQKQSIFYVNDDVASAMDIVGEVTAEKLYELNFELLSKSVLFDVQSGAVFPVNDYLNGMPFEGFTNGCAYVTYVFEDAENGAEIGVTDINWHKFNDEKADWIEPLIDFSGNIGGEYDLGDTFFLPQILATDVLSGNLKAYVTVKTPNGKTAVSTSGKQLFDVLYDGSEISWVMNEYGNYSITVTATDDNGNTANSIATIWVVDRITPTLTVSQEVVKKVKVGETVIIPKAVATDNLTQDVKVNVYVVLVGGKMMRIDANQDGFKATQAGTYTVVYYVADEAGNYVSKYYKIEATEV